jgi:hypothetical protein
MAMLSFLQNNNNEFNDFVDELSPTLLNKVPSRYPKGNLIFIQEKETAEVFVFSLESWLSRPKHRFKEYLSSLEVSTMLLAIGTRNRERQMQVLDE